MEQQPIRVLFLEPLLDVGGQEHVLFDLVTRLDRRQFEPIVLCLKRLGTVGEKMQAAGVDVRCLHAQRSASPLAIARLAVFMRRNRIKVLHTTNQPLTMLVGTVAALLAGVPARITTVHNTIHPGHTERRLWMNRLFLPFTDRVIAIARLCSEYLVKVEGVSPTKISTVYNGIEIQRFAQPTTLTRSALGLPDDAIVIGVPARLTSLKAHDNLIAAVAPIMAVRPNVHLALLGDGNLRDQIAEQAAAAGILARVHFLGERRDPERVYPLFDICTLASDSEGLPLVLLEGMAAGKPWVVTTAGAMAEVVIDGQTGFVVEKRRPRDLGRRLGMLIDDPRLRARMGGMARRRVEQFSVERMVADTATVFTSVLLGKTQRSSGGVAVTLEGGR